MTSQGLPESSFIHRELGKIVATLQGMKEDQDEFRQESKEHRIEVNSKLSTVEFRIATVEATTKSSAQSLHDDVLPTINKVRTWEQRGIGFLAFAGIAGTGLGAMLAKYGGEIFNGIGSVFK